jgi:hypothetical protein
MQAFRENNAIVHRCERCSTVISVANPPATAAAK